MWGPCPTSLEHNLFCMGTGGDHSQANAAPPLPSSFFLPVELPSVFAVLFEAAKAKSALCNSRVRLSKKRGSVFCV